MIYDLFRILLASMILLSAWVGLWGMVFALLNKRFSEGVLAGLVTAFVVVAGSLAVTGVSWAFNVMVG